MPSGEQIDSWSRAARGNLWSVVEWTGYFGDEHDEDCEPELRYFNPPGWHFIVTHGGAYQCPELDCRRPVFDGSDALR